MANKKIDGLTIAIKADTTGVTDGLKDVSDESKKLSNNLKAVDSLLKLDPTNTELLAERQKLLSQNIETSSKKLLMLKDAQEEVDKAFKAGTITDENYIAFQKEIVYTQKRLQDLADAESKAADTSNELAKEVDSAGDSAQNAKDSFSTAAVAVGTFIGNLSLDVLKSATSALKDLGIEVVKSYGELEQNLGGSEAVFGEYAKSIQKSGEEAYKNLGISQSEYLANANKMGALFQGSGLEVKESLELTEKAMQRAADTASVMGIDTSAALEAVTGAAKGNYTMMDNLGVAMNATSIEAYALKNGLIQEAEASVDISKLADAQDKAAKATLDVEKAQISYNSAVEKYGVDSAQAQKAMISMEKAQISLETATRKVEEVQEGASESSSSWWKNASDAEKARVAMQMFLDTTEKYDGNFAREATETVSGSFGLLEASMDSLVAGLGNSDADIKNLTQNVSDSLLAVVDNVVPVISSAVSAIDRVVSTISSELQSKMPELIEIGAEILSSLLEGVVNNLPVVADAALGIALKLTENLVKILPKIIDSGKSIILSLVEGIAKALPTLIPAAVQAVTAIVQGLSDSLPDIIGAALTLVSALADGLIAALPELMEALPGIISSLVNGLLSSIPEIIETGIKLFTALVDALPDIINGIVEVLPQIVTSITSAFMAHAPEIMAAGFDLLTALIDNLPGIIGQLITAIPLIVAALGQALAEQLPAMGEYGMTLFTQLSERGEEIRTKICELIPKIIESIGSAFMDKYGDLQRMGMDIFDNVSNGIRSVLSNAWTWGSDLISNFVAGIWANIQSVINAAMDIGNTIRDYIGFSEPDKGPLSNFHTFAPDMMELFASGIKDNAYLIGQSFTESLAGLETAVNVQGANDTPSVAPAVSAGLPVFNVNVSVGSISSDYDVNRMTDQMMADISEGLAQLQSRQAALVGR